MMPEKSNLEKRVDAYLKSTNASRQLTLEHARHQVVMHTERYELDFWEEVVRRLE